MGIKCPHVRSKRNHLIIEASVFVPKQWLWVQRRTKVDVRSTRLLDPVMGRKGGFKYAELRENGELRWVFDSDQKRFYERVKRSLRIARRRLNAKERRKARAHG